MADGLDLSCFLGRSRPTLGAVSSRLLKTSDLPPRDSSAPTPAAASFPPAAAEALPPAPGSAPPGGPERRPSNMGKGAFEGDASSSTFCLCSGPDCCTDMEAADNERGGGRRLPPAADGCLSGLIGKQSPEDDEDRVLAPTATAAPLPAAVPLRALAAADVAAKLHTVAPRSALPPSASCGADADVFFLGKGLLAPRSPQPLPGECGAPGSMDCKT
mmetsp:Transcript_56636/g.184227  ORF Transcript_56636/g.184227 Transcript_56636/m.184227 type:complete len:216 (-) Transcript_56636:804-1451(-)